MGAFVYNSRDGMAERYTSNGGYYVTGTELNDTIVNGGYYDSSNYYSLQADHLHRGDNVNINGWEGSDEILNHGDKAYIDGGTGNDSIKNHWGRNVTICGGKGDDTIICEKTNHNNQKELILYEPGDGNDVIYDFFDEEGKGSPELDYECIYIGSGDASDTSKVDDSYFDGSDFVLKIGDGSITLKDAKGKTFDIQDNYNNGGRGIYTKVKVLQDSSDTTPGSDETLPSEDNVIYGTPDDDTLENSRDKVKIEALAGNDDIINNGKSVTINGGKDKDSIKNFGSNTKINGDNGNDWIYNENANKVTIDSGSGNDYISNGSNAGNAAGSDISIDSGEGDDTIWNAGNKASIKLSKGKDKIENYGNKVTIDSGDDNDTILNYGTNVSIKSGNGDDTLSAETGESSTLHGEAGNDVIYLYDTKTRVFGGKGDDTIQIESLSDKATVNGNEDSDTFVLNLSTQNGQSRTGSSAVIQDYESGKDKIVLEKTSIASHSISGSDVILTLKSENISDYKLTLKNAKGKEITFTDSKGNTTKQTYTDDNSEAVSFISYDQLTSEELQELQESSIKSLKTLTDSFEEMDIEPLTFEECDNDPKIFAESKEWPKVTKFLAKVLKQRNLTSKIDSPYSMIADVNDIIMAINTITDKTKEDTEKTNASLNIYSKILNICDSITKWVDLNKATFAPPFAFLSSLVGFASNIIAPSNVLETKHRQTLERHFVNMSGELVKVFIEEIGGNVITNAVEKGMQANYNQILSGLSKEIATAIGETMEAKLKSVLSPFGPVNAGIAIITGAVLAVDQYNSNLAQYNEDKIPTSTRDALIDAAATGIYETIHKYTFNADDVIVQVGAWMGSLLTGKEFFNVSDYGDNWVDVFARDFKYRFFGEFVGTNSDDVLSSTKDGEFIYGRFGNDAISNSHSNMTIYGGADDDTVISTNGVHNNYIDLGLGNDSLRMHDNNSTVYSGNGKDTLFVGELSVVENPVRISGNKIFGENGTDSIKVINTDNSTISGGSENDIILLQEAHNNSISGDSGDDYIELQDSNNNVIIYRPKNGNDVIVGYNETDTIKFVRLKENMSYSTIEDDNDIKIIFDDEQQILLKDAVGKKLNIESSFIPTLEEIHNKLFNLNPMIMKQSGNLNLRSSESPQAVSLGSGSQTVQFNDADGNIAVVDENATGRKNIVFGKGDDLGVFTSSYANVKVTVGSGYDSIVVDNNARVNVDMTKVSDAIIIANNSKVTLTNYDASSNAGILVSDVENITSAIKNNSIQLVNDEVQLDSSTSIKINGNSKGSTIVNLITDDGDIQKVGFTGINGGSLDSSKLKGNLLLKGNYAESSSDNQGSHGSNIIAGKGDDTILAGARDTINSGSGHNQILLTPHDLRENKSGATIILSDKGRNTVQGFRTGFDFDSDCVKIDKISNIKFDFKNDGLILTSNDSRLQFDGIGTTKSEEPEKISLLEGDSTVDAAITQTNHSISINNDTVPDAFFGNRSGLNFNDYNGDININLAKEKGTLDGTVSIVKGFNKLQAGDGRNTLIGSYSNETLIAGNGYTSIWGGTGNDKLFGKRGSENKDGFTTFFFNSGDEHDTIADFEFITQDNRDEGIADKIDISDNAVTDVYHSGSDVVLQINNSKDYLTIKDAFGKDFQINNLIAKVDRNITYDNLANYYVADGGSSLTVDSSVDSAEIWLDNSHDTTFIGNIRTLNASAVEGNTSLVGNANDNTIIAGQGDASLWGGFSPADDLLIGGNSHNTFFYCNGNGHDTIQGTNNGDSVILSDISLNQITGTKITADAVSIDFIDGGFLKINGSSDITYQLADGSKFSANHERLEWYSK